MCYYFKKLFRRKHRHKHGKIKIRLKTTHACIMNSAYRIKGEIKMAGIGKAELKISITAPAGDVSPSVVETADDGSFGLSFIANSTGVYAILVEFAGDALTLASSATLLVDVLPLPPVPVASTITLVGPEVPVMVGDTVAVVGTLS